METDNIICPFCHKEFPLVEAISEKQRAWLEKEFFARHEKQYEEEKKELKKALTEKIRKDMDSEIKEKEEELENKSKELEAYKNQKRQLLKKERELEEARSAMALEIERKCAGNGRGFLFRTSLTPSRNTGTRKQKEPPK